ncbi:hypothetical protein HF086_017246 [Spodoptera exigua]|uniref:Secreted protein n=1 Tax=Spodoptera exigua TaxID=7107 RepID=A0A922MTY9_SPOEX|nr:hypothetical protein HF086_017246 [Spodoptera exigua]
MKCVFVWYILSIIVCDVLGYWDAGTTTLEYKRTDTIPRQSFFRWQMTQSERLVFFFSHWDWNEIRMRRRLNVVAGISIDKLNLGVASILNRRTLISSANYLDPWFNRQRDLRIWALGRAGEHNTPYRYRVWRLTRLFPKSLNPEHWHGPRGVHSPRHDICIIHSLDMIYIYSYPPTRYHYAYRTFLNWKHKPLTTDLWFSGSGYEYLQHVYENYKIFYGLVTRDTVEDCSKYIPKWWGKFICFRNLHRYAGVPNGGGLYDRDYITGIGCFEIRYNQDKIMVFTDLRYYMDFVHLQSYIWFGQYYEYAYPQWGIKLGYFFYDSNSNDPGIPWHYVQKDTYPLGKKK